MAFERKYQIKIPSKQLNIRSFSTFYVKNKQELQTFTNNNYLIDPWWITGFTDAECSFQIILR